MSSYFRAASTVARRLVHSSTRRQSSLTVPGHSTSAVENVLKDESETHSASYFGFLFFVVHPVAAAGLFAVLNDQGQGYGLGH
jgi:hypothetical protein